MIKFIGERVVSFDVSDWIIIGVWVSGPYHTEPGLLKIKFSEKTMECKLLTCLYLIDVVCGDIICPCFNSIVGEQPSKTIQSDLSWPPPEGVTLSLTRN